jgi:ABC-2 type transport system permease protein
MKAIYKREMRAYLSQMTGYVYLAFFLLLTGIWFVLLNVRSADGNFHLVLANVTILFFILIPVLTMRIFSEEQRQKTDQLLFTSPLSVTAIVLGKFFAALSLFLIGVVITFVFPLTLNNYGDIPVSQIAGTYVGFILLGSACIAIGVFVSVLTENQIIAALAAMGVIFTLFLIESIAASMPSSPMASLVFVLIIIIAAAAIWYNSTRKITAAIIAAVIGLVIAGGLYLRNDLIYDGIIARSALWFSVFARFNYFTRGILRLSDIVYYVSFSALFIYLTVNVIEKRRWR